MLAYILENSDATDSQDGSILVNSKNWSSEDWENYLKTIESENPEEEVYVGTANDLENFVAYKKNNSKLY